MSRPPWVWNSAPVTLIAPYGAVRRGVGERGGAVSRRRSRSAQPAPARRPRAAPRRPLRLRRKSGKVRASASSRVVEHVPGDAARLRQHLHRGLRVATGLVVEAPALGIDLHAAFHHQRPGDQRALRHRPGAVALVAAQVGQPRAELPAPGDRAAVVADMAGEQRVAPSRAAARAPSPRCRRSRCRPAAARGRPDAPPCRRGADSRRRSRDPSSSTPQLAHPRVGHQHRAGAHGGRVERRHSAAPVRCGRACMRSTLWPG